MAALNPQRGMVAVLTEDDGYTIIELLSDFELELGDKVAWTNDYGLGSEVYKNLIKGVSAEVYARSFRQSKHPEAAVAHVASEA